MPGFDTEHDRADHEKSDTPDHGPIGAAMQNRVANTDDGSHTCREICAHVLNKSLALCRDTILPYLRLVLLR